VKEVRKCPLDLPNWARAWSQFWYQRPILPRK
jgi:hypothetical protein